MIQRLIIRLLALKFISVVGLSLWPTVRVYFIKHKSISLLLFILIFCLFTMVILNGCSLVDQKLDPNIIYRRDIEIKINKIKYTGVAVPAKADKYKIKIKARGKIDMLTIRSCHRERVFEEPSSGWFSSDYTFEYLYEPIPGIEDGRGCLLDIGAYEKKKGRHSWATIDFETDTENIPAIVRCDGKQWDTDPGSVSICQARAGTIQQIDFDHRVKASPDNTRCDVLKTVDEIHYQYIMPLGECTYYFGDKYMNYHRHTTFGYDGLLIRGGE